MGIISDLEDEKQIKITRYWRRRITRNGQYRLLNKCDNLFPVIFLFS
jgi:hypothetical protein